MQAVARLDLAGRQRMYSQKLTKDVLLIHLGTNVETSLWQLEDTRAKFETVNSALYHGSEELMITPAKDPELLAQLAVISSLWGPFHEVRVCGLCLSLALPGLQDQCRRTERFVC